MARAPNKLTQKDILKGVRKPMPPPQKPYKDKTIYNRKKPSFKEFYARVTAGDGSQQYADTTVTAEGEYASSGGDNTTQGSTAVDNIGFKNNGPTFTVEKSQRDKIIDEVITYLEKLNKVGLPEDIKTLNAMRSKLQTYADRLAKVGIEPVDIIAAIENPRMAARYLITGPSAPGGGGRGALQDLKDIKAGLLVDDESNPGGADVTADIENIDYNSYEVKPYLNDPNNGKDQPEGALEEKKSKLDLAIEALTRREFLGKAGQAAKAVAGSSILPTGMLKGTLGATSALGAASKINFDIDKILTNLITLNVEGADIIPTKDFKGTILNNIKFEKKIYGDLFNAIKGNALSIPDDEVHNLGSHVTILGLFQNIITGKATKEEINALDGYFDFEARFGKKRLSLTELKELFEETSMDFNEGEAENLINSVLKDAFNNHQLKPETYKELSLHGYDWYQYVDSPEALRLRKQEAEKIAADNKKQQEEWQKQQKLQQDQEKEKEQAYGSRFDYGGGEQDRAEEPEEWVDTFATDPNNKGNLIWYKNNPGRGRAKPYGGPGTYTVDENFMDGKGPGRKGDSKRHGIKKKASLSSLDKIVRSKTASPRKKQLAHWQANMRRGKAKKKK